MTARIKQRLAGSSEQGFTLIELLVVIIIIGILLAIAVPSYLGFRDRAANSAAQANLRAAIPAIEAFAGDNDTSGTGNDPATLAPTTDVGYMGMTAPLLRVYDAGFSVDVTIETTSLAAGTYCIYATGAAGTVYQYSIGKGFTSDGVIKESAAPATPCT